MRSSPAVKPQSEMVDAAVSSLRALAQVTRAADQRRGRDLGVSPAQLTVLLSLSSRPGQSINDLARATRTHQTSVSPLVFALTEGRFVSRRHKANDVREAEVQLTPKGRRVVTRATDGTGRQLRDALQQITTADRTELIRIVTSLVSILSTDGAKSRAANAQTRIETETIA